MDSVGVGKLIINAVEYIFQVALGMYHGKFRRVEKTAGIQSVYRDEVSPLRAAISKVESPGYEPNEP